MAGNMGEGEEEDERSGRGKAARRTGPGGWELHRFTRLQRCRHVPFDCQLLIGLDGAGGMKKEGVWTLEGVDDGQRGA